MPISKINHVYRLYFSAYQQDLLAKKEEMLLKLFQYPEIGISKIVNY